MWDWRTESILAQGPTRVAVITAHPDDPDFGCAGTCAIWADMGHTVTYVIVTNGDKGSDDTDLSPQDLVATREREQRAAASILGVRDVIFLGYEDGMVVPDITLRRELVRVIRRLNADVVICDSPNAYFYSDSYINHPDHRAVAQAALEAIFPAAQNHRYFPELLEEGLPPHRVREVWIESFHEEPNTYVDVTGAMDRKLNALKEHVSQNIGDPEVWLREWMSENGQKHDPPVALAESFKVMRINRDEQEAAESRDIGPVQ